jgi:hypothetical protein
VRRSRRRCESRLRPRIDRAAATPASLHLHMAGARVSRGTRRGGGGHVIVSQRGCRHCGAYSGVTSPGATLAPNESCSIQSGHVAGWLAGFRRERLSSR